MDYSEFPLLDFKNPRSIVPELGPYASRITRRSQARVRERPLQSAVETLLLHTQYVHALARLSLAKAPTSRFSLSLKLAKPCRRASRYAWTLIPVLSLGQVRDQAIPLHSCTTYLSILSFSLCSFLGLLLVFLLLSEVSFLGLLLVFLLLSEICADQNRGRHTIL